MKVWVDHDLCTGDGLCEEICPSQFAMVDGVSHVRVGGQPALGLADISDQELDRVLDAAEECPGECIFIEP